MLEHLVGLKIVAIAHNENINSGQIQVIELAADIFDWMRGNRTLSGICHTAIFHSFTPDFIVDYALHWCTLDMSYRLMEASP